VRAMVGEALAFSFFYLLWTSLRDVSSYSRGVVAQIQHTALSTIPPT
jgi:hypothetical protein